MGLLDRLGRVIRANINNLISQVEDPEKILEQTVIDMQDDLIRLRQAVAQAIATQKRTERQATQAQSSAQEWYKRAQLALQKSEESLARESLTRSKSYESTAASLQAQVDQQRSIVTQMKQNMGKLEQKLAEAKTKKDMYIARARSAKASQQLNEMMDRFNTRGSVAAFERMEEKVLQLEAKSEAIAELSNNTVESQFQALEQGGDIDAELAAMKAQLTAAPNPTLPVSSLEEDPKRLSQSEEG